jgi:DnaJ-class molecular chaperone with C-terminal Zn finger domain
MQDDLYAILGVKKTATAEEIKKAYRKLARETHPDINPDDPGAKARFVKISAAYDILKDPAQRARYDAGEIDSTGAERPERRFYRDHAEAGASPFGRERWTFDGTAGPDGFEDIFADLFGQARRGARRGAQADTGFAMPGADHSFAMDVDFMDAARGATRQITLPEGGTLEVKIPAGIADGQTLRLRGKGGAGIGGAPAGDAYITVSVRPHHVFRREGDDIVMTLPVTIDEAILGAKVKTPTIDGPVNLTVPAGATTGQTLRLKGRGIARPGAPRGDQRVELKIVAPPKIDDALKTFMETWRAEHAYDPRKGMFQE